MLTSEEDIDLISYYDALDAAEADFRAAFVDEQGILQPDMRESLLQVFGIWNDTTNTARRTMELPRSVRYLD